MKTNNTRLLDQKENREYYSKSDGNYIDPRYATKAHLVLDRIAWAREWIHKVGSKYHFDVGCKDGYLGLTLASEGIKYVGIDPSKDAIDEAQLRANELDIENATFKVEYLEDVKTSFKFDSVSMLEVLEHVLDPDEAVRKLAQLGRFVLISTPDAEGRHGMEDSKQNEEHVRLYTAQELEALVSQYGEVMELVKRDDQLLVIFQSAL